MRSPSWSAAIAWLTALTCTTGLPASLVPTRMAALPTAHITLQLNILMIPSSDFGHALDLLFQARYYSLHSMQQAGIYKVGQSRAFRFISFHVFASLHQRSNKPCFLSSWKGAWYSMSPWLILTKNIVPDVITNHQHLTGTQTLQAQSCQGQMEKLAARLSHHLSDSKVVVTFQKENLCDCCAIFILI